MSDDQGTERNTSQATLRRSAPGHDTRSERRALRGAARRRRARTRFWFVVAPAVMVIALVVVLLVVLGGNGSPVVLDTTSTTEEKPPSGEGVLLVAEQDGSATVLVAVQARKQYGLVLAMPGITLLKTGDGFTTLVDLYASEPGVLLGALRDELGVQATTVASVAWPALREALLGAGAVEVPGERLGSAGADSAQLARSVLALIRKTDPEDDSGAWGRLALEGDATQFRTDLESLISSSDTSSWAAGALTGRVVEGERFTYLEPETDRLALLLAGPSESGDITVEIQNGAGMVGVVESATAELGSLGYTLVSTGNAADFPDARETRITVAVDAAEAGERVRLVLGVGAVVEDTLLDLGRIVVVLGKDYLPRESAAD